MNRDTKTVFENLINGISDLKVVLDGIPLDGWSLSSTRQYCEKYIGNIHVEEFERYMSNENNISSFDCNRLLESISEYYNRIHKLLSEETEWDTYNNQYQSHVIGVSTTISKILLDVMNLYKKASTERIGYFLSSLNSKLVILLGCFESNTEELYEKFKYGNKNYIVFGKNGAGKTTLLKKISSEIINTNSYVIPANRFVEYEINNYISISLSLDLNNKLSDKQNAIYYLQKDINDKSLEQYKNHVNEKEVITNKFFSIFKKLGVDREITYSDNILKLSLGSEDSAYDLKFGSDGERSIAYLIMGILLLPQNSFVFIDEPENHLNCALMRKLFDELEAERNDVVFIYLTHSTDFIESRKNYELIYLEKTEKYMTWKFHKLSDYNEIPVDVILNIEGTKDDILFCEGDDRNSIDYRVLKALYPDMEVAPVSSCEKVIANTKGLNGKKNIFRRNVFGLIDKDYRTYEEISSLSEENVYVLPFNEIENLLLDSEIVGTINNALFNRNMEEIKQHVISFISSLKKVVFSDYINKRYLRILSTNRFKYGDQLGDEIDQVNEKNKASILAEVTCFEEQFDRSVFDKDYDKLLSFVSGKMVLKKIANEIGCKTPSDYTNKFIDMLYARPNFKELVKSKLNLNFNQYKTVSTNERIG